MVKQNMGIDEAKGLDRKAWDSFASVLWLIPKQWSIYYSSLNIEMICYKEKSPCEFPRFK